jgi:transcription-repair coupling factor (superfamily II helicase)
LGEPVIHEDYGIGYLKEVKIFEMDNKKIDTFVIIFKENQKIYAPFYDIGKLERYSGQKVKITPLGSKNFFIKKLKAKIYAYDFAKKILEVMAERKTSRKNFNYEYKKEMDEIIISFPYEETEDQEKVWEEVKNDILSDKICDRLICGDVGFGKTEIALRVSSLVALNKKQVAILVPTTILAVQHEMNFKERLKNFNIRVESLTRLKQEEKQKEIVKGIENGEIDIIIGTHRILQEDIKFKDLGLLIIDDEHRFGIFQKEKIKFLKKDIDTIYLSATPIPRTLFLSINKIMDLSLLETPPPLKKEIETIITPYNIETIEKAINFELERGGQVIYIYNRIQRLKEIKEKIESIFPEAIVEIVHGRMEKENIEDIFINFMLGKIDILVSTSILEAGVDFPNANTLIVENPHLFGLAELHQIRGRVGRKDKKAYAYFLIPKNISENAKKRLKAIATYRHLGSGFKIALYDMKLRGAGKILDKKQHGIASSLGYNLFFKILDEEIKRIKGEKIYKEESKIVVESDIYIPREYIEDEEVIISIYKRLSESENLNEMKEIYYEIKDRFGEIPDELKKIFLFFYLKNLKKCKKLIIIQEGILCEEKFYKIQDFHNIFA